MSGMMPNLNGARQAPGRTDASSTCGAFRSVGAVAAVIPMAICALTLAGCKCPERLNQDSSGIQCKETTSGYWLLTVNEYAVIGLQFDFLRPKAVVAKTIMPLPPTFGRAVFPVASPSGRYICVQLAEDSAGLRSRLCIFRRVGPVWEQIAKLDSAVILGVPAFVGEEHFLLFARSDELPRPAARCVLWDLDHGGTVEHNLDPVYAWNRTTQIAALIDERRILVSRFISERGVGTPRIRPH